MTTWDQDCTMRYLNQEPLPPDFTWPHRDGGERTVWPVHTAVIGYGKWLRETPYFPGLFELIHEIADRATDELPDGPALAAQLNDLRKKHPEIKSIPGNSIAHQLRRLLPLPGQATLF